MNSGNPPPRRSNHGALVVGQIISWLLLVALLLGLVWVVKLLVMAVFFS